jgi:hypothetical protein
MSNLIKTLDSGAKIEIQIASFERSHRLFKAVTKEIESVKIALGLKGELKDILNLEISDETLNTLKDIVARLISSDTVEAALWDCMATVLYNGKKVTRDLFEDIDARKDFLVLMKEVMVYNLAPFFQNLGSLFAGITRKNTDAQK